MQALRYTYWLIRHALPTAAKIIFWGFLDLWRDKSKQQASDIKAEEEVDRVVALRP